MTTFDKEKLKPAFCCVAATDFCMLRCQMCNKWQEPLPRPDEQPSIEDWKRFLTQFRDLVDEGFEMDFGGGEALTMPGALDLIKHANDLGYRTVLASNGYIVDTEMAKKIGDSGLSGISLSLDSPTKELHDKIRGVEGVYDRVFQAVENISKYAPKTKKGLCCTIMNDNQHMLLDLANLADNNPNVDWLYFMAVVQPNYSGALDDAWLDEYKHLWPQDIPALVQTLDQLIERRNNGSKVSNSPEHLRAYKAYFQNPTNFVNKAECIIGGKALSINAYGFIQMCFFKDFIGNIRSNDIRELWYSQDADRMREEVKKCKSNCHLLLNCCFMPDDEKIFRE